MKGMLNLTLLEKEELTARSRSRKSRAEDVRRAKLILFLDDGESYTAVEKKLECFASYISKWRKRFEAERLQGLYPRYKGPSISVLTPQLEAKILSRTRRKPTDGTTHWSSRRLAKVLGINHMLVARAWNRAGLKPHQIKRYMASNDPDFEAKAADVIGLYINPPQHAAVFCVDEKTAIQALDRLDPVLPLSPGRAERHGFEYYRHGTLSLYAALKTSTGEVIGKTAKRHTSAEFVAFLSQIVATERKHKEIHIIADNLSAHKTKAVEAFLYEHQNVTSWLNQVEIWFSKLERQVIAPGIFTSVTDLAKKLIRYIRNYNESADPIKWRYENVEGRIAPANY